MTVNGNDDLRNQLATVTAQLTRAREGLERIANQDYEVADDDPDDDEGLIGAMSADARATLAAISDTAPAAPASTERLREVARLLEKIRDTDGMPIDWYRSRAEEANTALVLAVAGIAPAPVVAPTTGPVGRLSTLRASVYARLPCTCDCHDEYGDECHNERGCTTEGCDCKAAHRSRTASGMGTAREVAFETARKWFFDPSPDDGSARESLTVGIAAAIEARDTAWLGILEGLREAAARAVEKSYRTDVTRMSGLDGEAAATHARMVAAASVRSLDLGKWLESREGR
jgi:hypothetical protein